MFHDIGQNITFHLVTFGAIYKKRDRRAGLKDFIHRKKQG
jgi:hypothetical protein